ncbi:hypothetical protein DdX_11205 [Ditylenchus destructor]|uniref:Uncharacterized protein n=1 Tax=Ditylenchus destructor TaxID=166010 RepID=A0AAD4MWX3_9BILA|nr:hypothetical protein DdX_11205 [Ditylenchus destructor]
MWYNKLTPPLEFYSLVSTTRELFLNGLGIIPHLRTLLHGFAYSVTIFDQRHTKGYAMQIIPVTEIVDFLTKPCNGTDPVDLFVSASFLPTLEQRDEIIERIKQKFEDATSKLVIEFTWTTVEFLPPEVGETVSNYKTKTKLEITNNDEGLYIKTYDL